MKKPGTVPLQSPAAPPLVSADVVAAGPLLPAIERIKLFSAEQWEEFVLEWADSLRSQYHSVERSGGPGDMGRDVIGIRDDAGADWDNYQCKHYDHPLAPSDIWVEIGKLVYHTFTGAYSYPNRYYFVAPRGAGTKLSNLLRKPDELKQQLRNNWDAHCGKQISDGAVVKLDQALGTYIESLDFSIFVALSPLRLIDEHSKTRWYVARFGGGLPPRPAIPQPPSQPAAHEANYLRQLLDAYADHLGRKIATAADISDGTELHDHLHDARTEFYSAEALRAFSRDTLPPGEFERLQDEVHTGIRDEARSDHKTGYRRLLAVVRTARALQLTAHALISRLSMLDRGGICHQLAGDGKVRWVK
jgi:hypothetical protein